jgi:hypothetical protein
MPLVCQKGAVTDLGLELLEESGLEIGSAIHPFEGEEDYLDLLQGFGSEGFKLVVLFQHAPEDIDPAHYWIDPAIVSYVNNKANLGDLVAGAHQARRDIHRGAAVAGFFDSPPQLPVVLKAASDLSSGGGVDVRICRTTDDLTEAAELFRSCEALVSEEFLAVRRNFCLAYLVWPDGGVEHVGSTEQVSSEEGMYQGNWLGKGAEASPAVVAAGLVAAQAGAAKGYRGVVGIDVAETEDGRIIVFDLNFRMNGSSASALLRASVEEATGHAVMRFRPFKYQGSFTGLLDIARAAVARGVFVPLSTFDPETGGYPGTPAKVTGLVLGDSRADVDSATKELEGQGLE